MAESSLHVCEERARRDADTATDDDDGVSQCEGITVCLRADAMRIAAEYVGDLSGGEVGTSACAYVSECHERPPVV